MPTPKGRFDHARLKVQWAGRHINDLNTALQAFLKGNNCQLVTEEDPDTGSYTLKLISRPEIPAHFPLLIGDAVHCLRSSLDYVTSAIVGTGDDRVHFPMQETREELAASDKLRRIERADPAIYEAILHKIKPYGADNPLVALGRLNNIDKHKLLIPTFAITGFTGADFEDEHRNRFVGATLRVGTGGVLNALMTQSKIKITNNGTPTGDIFFNERGPFARASVIPTLEQLVHLTEGVIETLELVHFGQIPEGGGEI